MNLFLVSVVIASYGKRSNLDIKWALEFIKKKPGKLNNYIGVKDHVKTSVPVRRQLHYTISKMDIAEFRK